MVDEPSPAPVEAPVPDPPGDELETLRATLAARDEQLETTANAARALAQRLRAALVATEPGLPAELVTGETLDEIEASFAAAVALLGRVRDAVTPAPPPSVPAGAPGRAASEPANAFAKIRSGLGALG